MRAEDAFFAAVDRLYAAALDGDLWREALHAVGRAFDGQGATLELKNAGSGELLFFDYEGLDPKGVEEYAAHYHTVCRRWQEFHDLAPGDVSYDYRLMSEAELRRDEFTEDFLKRFDLRYYVAGMLANDRTAMGLISVQRTARVGHVADGEIRRMSRLVPHVRRALELHLRLRRSWRREQGLRATLARLKLGAVLVDRRANVMFANDAALVLLGAKAPLSLARGGLRARRAADNRRFGAMLRAALEPESGHPPSAGTLELGDASRRLSIVVLPLSERPELEAFFTDLCEDAPAAVVFVSARGLSARALALLAEAHGLTAAERQLACALLEGRSVAEHATARGVTIHTARTHLVNLRAKLGARTQAEVIERLLSGAQSALR